MAKKRYKRSYEQKGLDPLKIGGIAVVVLLVVLSAIVGAANIRTRAYHLDSWNDLLTQESPDDMYFVYFYHVDCPACRFIESDMDAFRQSNALDIPVFYIDAQRVSGQRPAYITGTPTLILIENGETTDLYTDDQEILNLIEVIETGQW